MMKKIFMILAAALVAVSVSAQTVEYSRTFENISVTLTGGAITTSHPGSDAFFWNGAENVVGGIRPVAGLEISKYITPVVGFGLEGLAMFNTTKTDAFIAQSNVVGNFKLNLSNWFGGYLGEPRRVEVVFVPGLGWGHDYGDVYYDRNYLTYNLGAELNINLGKARAWQINVKPVAVWNNYKNALRPLEENLQARVQVGVTYKFGSKKKNGAHNFVLCPYSVTKADYEMALARIAELEARQPEKVIEIREVPVKEEVVKIDTVTVVQPFVTIYFGIGSAELTGFEKMRISDFVETLPGDIEEVVVTGSADTSTGTITRNVYLAKQRALVVAKELDKLGVKDAKTVSILDIDSVPEHSRVAVIAVR